MPRKQAPKSDEPVVIKVEDDLWDGSEENVVPFETDLKALRPRRNKDVKDKNEDECRYNEYEFKQELKYFDLIRLPRNQRTLIRTRAGAIACCDEILAKVEKSKDPFIYVGLDSEGNCDTIQTSIKLRYDDGTTYEKHALWLLKSVRKGNTFILSDGSPPPLITFLTNPRLVFIGKDIEKEIRIICAALKILPEKRDLIQYIELDQLYMFAYNATISLPLARRCITTDAQATTPYRSPLCPASLKQICHMAWPPKTLKKLHYLRGHRNNFNEKHRTLTDEDLEYGILDAKVSRESGLTIIKDILHLRPEYFVRVMGWPSGQLILVTLERILSVLEGGQGVPSLAEREGKIAEGFKKNLPALKAHVEKVDRDGRRWLRKRQMVYARMRVERGEAGSVETKEEDSLEAWARAASKAKSKGKEKAPLENPLKRADREFDEEACAEFDRGCDEEWWKGVREDAALAVERASIRAAAPTSDAAPAATSSAASVPAVATSSNTATPTPSVAAAAETAPPPPPSPSAAPPPPLPSTTATPPCAATPPPGPAVRASTSAATLSSVSAASFVSAAEDLGDDDDAAAADTETEPAPPPPKAPKIVLARQTRRQVLAKRWKEIRGAHESGSIGNKVGENKMPKPDSNDSRHPDEIDLFVQEELTSVFDGTPVSESLSSVASSLSSSSLSLDSGYLSESQPSPQPIPQLIPKLIPQPIPQPTPKPAPEPIPAPDSSIVSELKTLVPSAFPKQKLPLLSSPLIPKEIVKRRPPLLPTPKSRFSPITTTAINSTTTTHTTTTTDSREAARDAAATAPPPAAATAITAPPPAAATAAATPPPAAATAAAAASTSGFSIKDLIVE